MLLIARLTKKLIVNNRKTYQCLARKNYHRTLSKYTTIHNYQDKLAYDELVFTNLETKKLKLGTVS
jgi:hypothetical protein